MNTSGGRRIAIALFLLSCLGIATVIRAAVPADLEIIAAGGGASPWDENAYIRITSDGHGQYVRYVPGNVGQAPLEEQSFVLSESAMDTIWQVIQGVDFFDLADEYRNDDIVDRSFAMLTITANGTTHQVNTRNIAVSDFDAVVAVINYETPPGYDLNYDTTVPPSPGPGAVCGTALGTMNVEKDWELRLRKWKEAATSNTSPFELKRSSHLANGSAAHPGTAVGFEFTLQEAVNSHMATLKGKGNYFGDQVSISVTDAENHTNDKLGIQLNLEFWGPAATDENVLAVKSAIEARWGGRTTSGGKSVDVEVNTLLNTTATRPPGTAGYHQIELREMDAQKEWSTVSGMGAFGVNHGTGSGDWSTNGSNLDAMYAHEAGHLMGLSDQYVDYRKQADGNWLRLSDNQILTSADLATGMVPLYPALTKEQIQAWLDGPGIFRVSTPTAGHETDLMATLDGSVRQSAIDAITNDPGVIAEVRPGTIIVNKNGENQSFLITHSENIFVTRGSSKTLDGLYVACIDLHKHTPGYGQLFDLAPPLGEWEGIVAAQLLLNLANYVDTKRLFCDNIRITQYAVWRLTDNYVNSDPDVQTLLQEAGADPGNGPTDFPRLSNPSAGSDTTTGTVLPQQLFIASVDPAVTLGSINENVTLAGSLTHPSVQGLTVSSTWGLETPEGSLAQLSDPASNTLNFTPDVRGIYRPLAAIVEMAGQDTIAAFTRAAPARVVVPDQFTETFENDSLGKGPFYMKTFGQAAWRIDQSSPFSGEYRVRSGEIGDGDTTALLVDVQVPEDGQISFAFGVSSEPYDVLAFLIDGELQWYWSGDIPWDIATFHLGPGDHRLIWVYVKDASYSEGLDAAWLDDIFFPPNTLFKNKTSVLINEFQALPTEHGVELSWNVASDEGIKGFRVYRNTAGQATGEPLNSTGLLAPDVRSYIDASALGGQSYEYTLGVVLTKGSEVRSLAVTVKTNPYKLSLRQNYPNPFNPATTILFTLPEKAHVNLSVFNAEGKFITCIADGTLTAGIKEFTWDGRDSQGSPVTSGIYFYQLKAGKATMTRKMVLLK